MYKPESWVCDVRNEMRIDKVVKGWAGFGCEIGIRYYSDIGLLNIFSDAKPFRAL